MKSALRKPGHPSPVRKHIGETVTARLDAQPALRRARIDTAQVYTCPTYLDATTCDTLIAAIDAGARQSTLLTYSSDPNFRTSSSCDLDRWDTDIRVVDEGLAELLGIDPVNGETMQGQRYAVGQQFRAHHDYFHEGESYWNDVRQSGGQRTWTAMIFLNDVAAGGATWFPEAGLRVNPKRGLLLVWNNMAPDGSPNIRTLHEGMAVAEGTKYIVTKWFREQAWLKAD